MKLGEYVNSVKGKKPRRISKEKTKEFSIPLLAGDNYLTAEFEGTGANLINGDTQGIKFMNFWHGKVESNTLRLSL